jgi:hypothetical protein
MWVSFVIVGTHLCWRTPRVFGELVGMEVFQTARIIGREHQPLTGSHEKGFWSRVF